MLLQKPWSFAIPSLGLLLWFSLPSAAATVIYRSVGPGSTGPLANGGSSNLLSISGSTAIFSSPLPDGVGVGDMIQYDADNNGTVDALAVIHGRVSSTSFTVKTPAGGIPAAVVNDLDWAVYRAYTSLYNAERGRENTGITLSLRDFDAWTGGKDLVGGNESWNIACYADAEDTGPVDFNGWTTGADNYIRIFTPCQTSEAGASQRHSGAWNENAYRINVYNDIDLTISTGYVRVEGLQMYVAPGSDDDYGIFVHTSGTSDVRISDNIIWGAATGYHYHSGIELYDAGSGELRVWNNFIIGFAGTGWNCGMEFYQANFTTFIYNNTIVNCTVGITNGLGTAVAKNNIVQWCDTNYDGDFAPASDYNLSDDGDAPGAHSKNHVTAVFADAGSDGCHLSATDTAAKDAGTSLDADAFLAFTEDIDRQQRSGFWDIGADEYMPPATPTSTMTLTPAFSPTLTPTRTRTPTPSVSATHTATRTPSPTRTPSLTSSATPQNTPTPLLSPTISATLTESATYTPSPTVTPTPSITSTLTVSSTATASPTRSWTSTAMATLTLTPTPVSTATRTPPAFNLGAESIIAYPVPAVGQTVHFIYKSAEPARVQIEVFNVTGEKVMTLENNQSTAGIGRMAWDISRVAPGVYLYRLKISDSQGQTISGWKKMLVVKK